MGTICELEAAFGDRRSGTAVRLDRKRVLLLARDAPFGHEILGGDAHVADAERVGQRCDHGVDQMGVAHARAGAHRAGQVAAAAHHFDAAAYAIVAIAEQDVLRRRHDGLQAGRAQAVHRHGDRLHRQPGLDRRHARHVGEPALGGDGVAHGHVVDRFRIDAGTRHRFLHHGAGQFGRFDIGQGAAISTDGGTDSAQDHNFFAHL